LRVLLFPVLAFAQDDSIATGAVLFRTHCSLRIATAPPVRRAARRSFAGRSFTRERLIDVIANGIPKTAMPASRRS